MGILRFIAFGATMGLSTLVVCFVSADRLAHSPSPAVAGAPVPRLAQAAAPLPEATVTQTAEVRAPAKAMGGFDTERLNALMRGEGLPAAGRKR
ncbi:hypothetical protein [Methylobacterium organophilum]|uniref:Uncharacterized protein n=1 Tax=Methylobacterium organophilum TaxID=410 RepID=A0ABQ4TG61_METOR|nr:hypothetical protein [Methylobacterium organophilum]UMY18422.1 hypothetical protein MMB17_03525 [Methylobacterium organophilum]GJE29017.1 hypothetical protein LKMONMHP_3892 [Methylobacterium organophilum]